MYTKTFRAWAVEQYAGTGGRKGKLADDMKADKEFTAGWSKRRNQTMLELREASASVMAAFEEMWTEYEAYKRNTYKEMYKGHA